MMMKRRKPRPRRFRAAGWSRRQLLDRVWLALVTYSGVVFGRCLQTSPSGPSPVVIVTGPVEVQFGLSFAATAVTVGGRHARGLQADSDSKGGREATAAA